MAETLRRQREIARTREDILRAAARAFARSGYEAATMQQIAKEAGYTVASIYSYFEGKREIIDGLIATVAGGILGSFDERMPAGLAFPQRLELLLQRQLQFGQDWREALTLFFTFKSSPAAAPRVPESDVYAQRLTDWISRTARPDDIGRREPEEVAYLLKGILQAVFTHWLRSGGRGPLADRARYIVEVLLHGVRGPAERRTKDRAGGG